MVSLYLTPAALSYLTQLILTVLISGYFVFLVRRQANPPQHLRCLTSFFLSLAAFMATLFFEAALPPTTRLYAVFLQVPLLAASWLCMTQFAYHFPPIPASLRREAQVSLWVSGLYTLWETGYAVFRFIRLQAGVVEYRIDWTDYLLLLFLIWPAVVCIRELYRVTPTKGSFWARLSVPWRHPADREARALRDLIFVFLFVAGLSIFNILRTFYLVPVALANTGIAIGALFALFIFALAYLNQQVETTSFMIKLAGITLTTMLAIMSAVGWVITPAHTADYQYNLTAPRAWRFTAEATGGYHIDAIPYAFETAPGRDLRLDDGLHRGCSEALDFAFPFFGQEYHAVYVCNDGVISLGQPVRYREFQYRYGAGTPLLLPLLLDLDPTISPGGVFARQEADRLVITWERLYAFRQPHEEFTFQAVLYTDGRFDFVYADLPEHITFLPNDDPGASLWAIGALPGRLHGPGPRPATLTGELPIHSGAEGIVHDFHLDYRLHLHRLLAPLARLILAASALIVLGFPLLFRVSLVQPLNALLAGVHRIEAGEYDVAVPEQAADEIGFLTRTFNALSGEVGNLIRTLEDRVAARTTALDAANAQLRAEIVEREQAQITLLEQQRLLARYEEREHMGRELHDGLGQVMGYINVQAQAAQTLLQTGQIEAAQNALTDLIPAAQDAHTDIRAHILGLRARETTSQDFSSTLRDLLEQFGQQQHIATRLSAPEPFPRVLFAPAVEEQVARILQEGLANIRKHAHAQRVTLTISLIGDYVQIMLADDGVGFDANQRISESANQQIAHPASSIQNHFGLQIMRERAEQVGGTLEIRSAPGEGTRLLLTMPRFVPTVGNAESASLQHVRLLLADDHPLFLDGLRNLLTARGLNVIGVAYDGIEVQEKARALRPDVVVMDVNMPKCNGLEATRAIKAEFPEMKVLMLTAAEDERVLFEALKSGASGYLLKNLDANRFCAAITDLLRDETPIAPGLAGRMLAEFARLASTPATAAGTPATAAPKSAAAPDLTPQQWDILRRVAEGIPYKEIAATLHITEQTVKYHMTQILTRLQVENRAQAIAYYRQTRG
ncbi:MAG: response regulator [Anaerolineae bacterium]